ncbi:MAG: ABC transporter permease [Candidatus Eremiobacteraeota bacterium]|nr:ABC transporter permease [Candidatus Eremiobacteraeota bacterium]
MIGNILLVASLIWREATRRRLLPTVAIFSLVLIGATAWGLNRIATFHNPSGHTISHYELTVLTSVLVVMMAFMFCIIVSLVSAFLGALSMGVEIENGILLAIVPRPLRRFEIVLGKLLGNIFLMAAYTIVIGAIELAVVRGVTGYVPPHPVVALLYLTGVGAVTLLITMCLSVRVSAVAAGFAAIVLFGLARIAGFADTIASALNNTAVQQASLIVSLVVPSDGLWRGAAFALEPAAMVGLGGAVQRGNPFIALAPPTYAYLAWSAAWAIAFVIATIALFARRDL